MKNLKRTNYINWDEFFMGLATLAAMRSKDPSTQVGACIASGDNRILSTGYNGTPIGFDDNTFPWNRDGLPTENKYFYVVHAERNAVLNYKGLNQDFVNAKVYVTLFPCNECAKELVQLGIKEVIYLEDKYAATDEIIVAKNIFEKCGVNYRKLDNFNLSNILKDNEDVKNEDSIIK